MARKSKAAETQLHAAAWVIYDPAGNMLVDSVRDRRIECQQSFAVLMGHGHNAWRWLFNRGYQCKRLALLDNDYLKAADPSLWNVVMRRATR